MGHTTLQAWAKAHPVWHPRLCVHLNLFLLCASNLHSQLAIIGIDEGQESQVRGIDQIFNQLMKENFPKLRKAVAIYKKHADLYVN